MTTKTKIFKIEKTATKLSEAKRARYRELSDAMCDRIISRKEEIEFKSLCYAMNGWSAEYANKLANRAYAISKNNQAGRATAADMEVYWYITDSLMTNDFGMIYGAIKLLG